MKIMNTRILTLLATSGIIAASMLGFVACSDDNAVTEPAGGSTSGTSGSTSGQSSGDAGPLKFDAGLDDAGNPKNCFDPPLTTHLQIINACTNADKIVRTPKSSKIPTDGGALPKP